MNALRLIAALAVLAPSAASADVAPPPAESLQCPRGAVGAVPEVDPDARDPRGRPVQPWPYCAPSTCATDDDCDGGRVCSTEEIGLCVEEREQSGATVRQVRNRPCEPDGTCLNVHSECEVARRCVEPSEATGSPAEAVDPEAVDPQTAATGEAEPPSEDVPEAPAAETQAGCACRAAPSGAPAPWALAALLGLALLRRR